jgi:hypothetical protein
MLRYSAAGGLLGAGTSTTLTTSYYLNSPGSLTHYPKGFNILKLVYDEYLVTEYSYRITATNLSASMPLKMYIVPVSSEYVAVLSSNLNVLAETDGVITRQLGNSGGGHDVAVVNYPLSKISALAGLGKAIDTSNEDFIGYTGSSNSLNSYTAPINSFQVIIGFQSMNGSNIALNSITISVEIDMNITFLTKLAVY